MNLFYSVKDILDGIDSIFAPLVNLANDAIAELLKFLPSFSLPGMFESSIHLKNVLVFGDQGPKIVITAVLFVFAGFPDFGKIFNINYNFNFPTINLDVSFATPLFWLGWDCSTQVKNVCSAGTGAVSFNCAKSLSSYKPTFSWGRRKRSVTSSSDNIQAE